MNKKVIAVIIVVAMLMAFVGCGTKPNNSGSNIDTERDNNNETGSEVFKIGLYQTMSGPNAIYGEESINAIKMMIKDINGRGGFHGKELELVSYDDQGSPEEAVKAVTKLIEVDKVDAVIGSVISSCVLAASGYLNDAQIVSFGTGLSPTWMEQGWEYVFRACVNSDYVTPLVAQIVKDLGFNSTAIFQGQDDSAIATGDSYKRECENLGVEVKTVESYAEGDSDYSGQITKILNSGAESVFMSTVGATYPVFIKQLRSFGYDGIIFNKESLPQDSMAVAGDAANYIAFAAPYLTYNSIDDCEIPNMKQFLQKYYDEFGVLPTTDSAYRSWDSMLVLTEAIKIAGTTEHIAIKDSINKISDLQGLGGILDYTSGKGEGLENFNKFVLVDGKNVLLDQWISSGAFDAWKKNRGN